MSEIPGQGPGADDEGPGDECAGDREDEQDDAGNDGQTRGSHGIRTARRTDSGCGSPGSATYVAALEFVGSPGVGGADGSSPGSVSAGVLARSEVPAVPRAIGALRRGWSERKVGQRTTAGGASAGRFALRSRLRVLTPFSLTTRRPGLSKREAFARVERPRGVSREFNRRKTVASLARGSAICSRRPEADVRTVRGTYCPSLLAQFEALPPVVPHAVRRCDFQGPNPGFRFQ